MSTSPFTASEQADIPSPIQPDEWLTTNQALQLTGLSRVTLIKYGRQLGVKRRGVTNIYSRVALEALSEKLRSASLDKRIPGPKVERDPPHPIGAEVQVEAMRALAKGDAPLDIALRFGIHPRTMIRLAGEYQELSELSPPRSPVSCSKCGAKGHAGRTGEHPQGECPGFVVLCGDCGPCSITPGQGRTKIESVEGTTTIPRESEKSRGC